MNKNNPKNKLIKNIESCCDEKQLEKIKAFISGMKTQQQMSQKKITKIFVRQNFATGKNGLLTIC